MSVQRCSSRRHQQGTAPPPHRRCPCLHRTISSLGVLTGAQLFSLNKEELKTVCPDDGARVFSQVTVQKAALEVGGA